MSNQLPSIEERLDKLTTYTKTLKSEKEAAFSHLKSFAKKLYTELERILSLVEKSGLGWVCEVKRYTVSEDLESIVFHWDDIWIVFLPARHASLPRTKANLYPPKHQGRIVVFMTFDMDKFPADPLGEIYISPNGTWTTLGLPPGNRIDETVTEDNITELILSLLETLTFNSKRFHKDLEPVLLTEDVIKKKGPLGYILHSEDR